MLTRPGHIVVADHQGNLDRFVCNVVGQEHWLIQHVENALDLTELSLNEKPDIIVVNAHLPDLQVQELSQKLETAYGADKPLVILAISRDPETFLQRGIQLYVDEVLIAPFYGVELLTKIHNFVRQKYVKAVPPVPANPVREPRPLVEKKDPAKIQSLSKKARPQASPEKPSVTDQRKGPALSFARQVTSIKPPVPKPGKQQKEPDVVSFNNNNIPNETKTGEWSIRKKMTLLLVRLNGLERAVDDLDADLSIQRLQQIYKLLTDEVTRLGGRIVSKYGDSMVFLFSNSAIISNHRISALQAAMQLQLSALFFSEKIGHLSDQLSLSCVLHTSMMTLGGAKDQDQGDTTVIGSALPLAMRLLEFCPANQIIATHDCYHDVADHVCIAEEFLLSNEQHESNQLRFARISGLNASEYVLHGVGIFRAVG